MPKIGAHVSIAGGVVMAPERAHNLGCETFQCFTRSPQGGPAPTLTPEIITQFKENMDKYGIENFYIHTPYYINFASLEPKTRYSSIKVVREELERGSKLGAKYVMTHLGSYTGQTLEEGIEKVAKSVIEILTGYKGSTELLLEISAGTGNVVGDNFEEVSKILKRVKSSTGFGGICFDTCHAFASGYDFRTPQGLKSMLSDFDKKIGLKYLKLTHVSDSMVDAGGKRDRHEHIGDGFIGFDGIAKILNSQPFKKIDWLLETPDLKRPSDIKALNKIRNIK